MASRTVSLVVDSSIQYGRRPVGSRTVVVSLVISQWVVEQ